MNRRITAHISPYLGGLAPETHHFVAELNKEAIRLKLPVRFTATANRILATGDLKRAAKSATLGGWTLRRAIKNGYLDQERRRVWLMRAIRRQSDSEIEGERLVLKRGNSQRRGKLRRYEKNRRVGAATLEPWFDRWRDRYLRTGLSPSAELAEINQLVRLARIGEDLLTPQEVLEGKAAVAAGTLYHLIDAIPVADRDWQEIYPGDLRSAAHILRPLQTNWAADLFEWWGELGWLRRHHPKKTFGLKDYSQPVKLNGRTELRQKAAPPFRYNWVRRPSEHGFCSADVERIPKVLVKAQDYGLDPHWDAVWRDCDFRLSLYALGRLKTPDEQRLLLHIGRFYKSSCWYSRKESRTLFDKCEASSSKAADWSRHRVQFNPLNPRLIEKREAEQLVRSGGEVVVRIPGTHPRHVAAKRYARLAATQESDNKKWVSYLNNASLSRRMRDWRSLNIEPEPIETPPVRQTTEADTCQPFTKNLLQLKVTPSHEPCSPSPPALLRPPRRSSRTA
jgi:hypothetical protein